MNRVGGKDGERQEIEKDMGWRGGGGVKKKRKKRGRESRQGFMLSIYVSMIIANTY